MEQYQPEELRQSYRALQSGETRMRAIRQAAAAAEQANDLPWAIRFHHDLIHESVFSGDRYQALVDFPQYLALVKRDPALEKENLWDTLWMFKWIVEAATEFYQIEKVQVIRWFSEYRRMLLENGYSLRSWYEKRAIFFSYCDRAKMRMDFDSFLEAKSDGMSDGEASDLNSTVRFALETGNRERSMQAANQIFSRNLRTEEVPCKTYLYLLRDAVRRGDADAAAQYAEPLRALCSGQRFQLEPIGTLLAYDAAADPARGLEFYAKNRALREGSRNPFLCFWFDRGAAMLLKAAAERGCTLSEVNGAVLTPEQLAAKSAEMMQNCRSLAEKFDARNKSDFFASAIAVSPTETDL